MRFVQSRRGSKNSTLPFGMSGLQEWPARQKLPLINHPGYDYAKIAPENMKPFSVFC